MSKNGKAIWLALVLLPLVSCDPAYPLLVRNGLPTPVTVRTTFEQGVVPSEGLLQPGERLAFMHAGGNVERVVVMSGGKVLFDLDKAALTKMRGSVRDPRQVVWNVQEDGVKPVNRADLERGR